MPPKKPVVVEPAPSDILVPEVLHSIAKSMQRGALFRIVFRSRPLVGQDPEANTDAVFTVAEAVDAEGYAWLRYADCSHDPAVKAGGASAALCLPAARRHERRRALRLLHSGAPRRRCAHPPLPFAP
eukprot:PhM_4_TR385/c2_g1_i5/m.104395